MDFKSDFTVILLIPSRRTGLKWSFSRQPYLRGFSIHLLGNLKQGGFKVISKQLNWIYKVFFVHCNSTLWDTPYRVDFNWIWEKILLVQSNSRGFSVDFSSLQLIMLRYASSMRFKRIFTKESCSSRQLNGTTTGFFFIWTQCSQIHPIEAFSTSRRKTWAW